MLVLNTYTESAPWSSHIINSIVAHIDQVDNFEVYTENMNSLLMTFKKHKTGEIESFKNNLLREYGKNPPRMLVLLGAPIAVLRDFVKQTWPGVPLILCSEMDYIGPENAYLDRRPLRPEERLPLCDKAVSDNITLIRTPLYLRENVELMRRMIPGMDSLIFVGDGRYINQQADSDLRELLDREFPQIDYRFYSAHEMSTEALLDSLNRIDIHRTGILFSSWHYTKKIGDNIVSVTDSYRVIASVQAPMFALMLCVVVFVAHDFQIIPRQRDVRIVDILRRDPFFVMHYRSDVDFFQAAFAFFEFFLTTLAHSALAVVVCFPCLLPCFGIIKGFCIFFRHLSLSILSSASGHF